MTSKLLLVSTFSLLCIFSTAQESPMARLNVDGLHEPVEIYVDHWGVPHIYAQNEHDLFFAQGYHAAKDRLFQFEIWRRQATGTMAEILGKRELKRDIGTRLFKFRGDMVQEMNHYHPRGKLIIESYVEGVNAYIDYANRNPNGLPLEFELLGIQPEKWTPAVVISRHQGLLGNISDELSTAQAVAAVGEEKVKEVRWFHPEDPDLTIDPAIDASLLDDDVIAPYNAYRRPVRFTPDDLVLSANSWDAYQDLAIADEEAYESFLQEDVDYLGSNNWVIDGSRTESGYPIMANDPHRRQSTPSLRYMAHLVAPGWDVIGGGEPEIPGISIGHNQHGAWGLTVFRTDAEDLYVYDIHPDDPHKYRYQGQWVSMTLIQDTVKVKGEDDYIVEHAYTRHGPVTKIDTENHVAYAMRCGWLEVGGSPYLASLRMNQATNWEEFKDACTYSHIPGENMVWADKEGNIGWQAVGITPIRPNWSGMVPVPGDGRYEWSGYLPISSKPSSFNPANGIINTSNENVVPEDYEFPNTVSFSWADPYRGDRVMEVLANGKQHSMADMAALQMDYLSIPARQIIPMYDIIIGQTDKEKKALRYLRDWNFEMRPESIAAGIYRQLEDEIKELLSVQRIPKESILSIQVKRMIEWLMYPDGHFGKDPIRGRDQLLEKALSNTIASLNKKLGTDMSQWQYGQEKYKHIMLRHPMSNAVTEDVRKKIDIGPYPRGGYGLTVNSTGSADNQPSGGSFRIISDTYDWDHTLATNNPGQNGNPEHPQYKNLFELWAQDRYFPLFYTKAKVESVTAMKWMLDPK